MTTPNADKKVEKVNLSYLAGGNMKWCSHSIKNLAVSLKIKNILIIQFSNCIPGHLSHKNKSLYTIVHSSFIGNSQKLKTTKMPFDGSIVNGDPPIGQNSTQQ